MASRRHAILIGMTASLISAATAFAHPFHASRTELEWNAQAGTLQAAIRVWPADLEAELSEASGRPIDLATSDRSDAAVLALFEKQFVLRDGDRPLAGWKWVGKEIGDREGWIYLELSLPDAPEDLHVSQRIFLFRNDDQSNVVTLLRDGAAVIERECRKDAPWVKLSAEK